MTDPAQLESDAALALRLQEEEFSHGQANPAWFSLLGSSSSRRPGYQQSTHHSNTRHSNTRQRNDFMDLDSDNNNSNNSDTPHNFFFNSNRNNPVSNRSSPQSFPVPPVVDYPQPNTAGGRRSRERFTPSRGRRDSSEDLLSSLLSDFTTGNVGRDRSPLGGLHRYFDVAGNMRTEAFDRTIPPSPRDFTSPAANARVQRQQQQQQQPRADGFREPPQWVESMRQAVELDRQTGSHQRQQQQQQPRADGFREPPQWVESMRQAVELDLQTGSHQRQQQQQQPPPPQQTGSQPQGQRSTSGGNRPSATGNTIFDALDSAFGSMFDTDTEGNRRTTTGTFQLGPGVVHIQTQYGSSPSTSPGDGGSPNNNNDSAATRSNTREELLERMVENQFTEQAGARRNNNRGDPSIDLGPVESRRRHRMRFNRRTGRNNNNSGNAPRGGGDVNSLQELFSILMPDMEAGPGGNGPTELHFHDMLRNFLPNMALHGNETYEDMLNIIERMGGNVNRSATDAEVDNLQTHIYRSNKHCQSAKGAGPSSVRLSEQGAKGDNESDDKCAICLGTFEDGDELKTLPCGHNFRKDCIDRWLKVNRTCPICKQSIRPSDTDTD